MWTSLIAEGGKELANLPLLLLQYTAVLGLLGMVLMAYRAQPWPVRHSAYVFGAVLGITGYLLTALVAEFIQSPSKPYVRNDLLFLACLLGGWRSGGMALVLIWLARWQFGGSALMMPATLDMLMMCAGGLLAHGLVRHRAVLALSWRQLLLVWLLRVVVGLAAVWVVGALGLSPTGVNQSILARRLFAALPALALLAGLYAIFKLDARHLALQQRARARDLLHPLTGLRNRAAMLHHLERLFRQPATSPHALVLLQPANYSEMLSAHGHTWADRLWRDVASHIGSPALPQVLAACRPEVFQFTDTALAVVLHGVSSRDVERRELAHALHQSLHLAWHEVASPSHLPQLRLSVTHLDSSTGTQAAEALRDAGLLLQHRMDLGEPVHFFHRGFVQQAAQDAKILSCLMAWIDTGHAPMGYQPKCRLKDLRVEGAEALLRPEPVDHVSVTASQVLAVAARHQLLAALEWSTVQTVVRDATTCWHTTPGVRLSVNISGASLAVPGFAERVQAALHGAGLPAGCIAMELTETSPLPDVATVKANLRTLHACGIELSLDDFGSGYSALSVLAHHPFAEVKIDQHMVALIEEPRMRSAIQIALDTARHYDARFVAEGVETTTQRDALAAMGVDTGQGHLFAAALPLCDFLAFVRTSLALSPGPAGPVPAP